MIGVAGKGAYPSINQKDVESLQIPLPPLDVQKGTVAEIEGLPESHRRRSCRPDNHAPHPQLILTGRW